MNGDKLMKILKMVTLALSTCMILGSFAACSTIGGPEETTAGVTQTSAIKPTEQEITAESSTEASVSGETSEETGGDTGFIVEDIDLDGDMQTKANTFITNFAELYFYDYDRESSSFDRIIDFAHIHLKINSRDSITYEQKGDLTFETFSLEKAQSTAGRYFGTMLKEEDYTNLPAPPSTYGDQPAGPYYEDGRFWYEAADGEGYNLIGIVDSAQNNGDGTLILNFTIYSIEFGTFSSLDDNGVKAYYRLTPEQARADATLEQVNTGTATVGISQSGDFYLITYKV